MKNKLGFTLLELLVVVLIIGILASIALPQYRRSVEKAKLSEALLNFKAIEESAQRYILANGLPNASVVLQDFLDIDLSGGEWRENGQAYETKDFFYGASIRTDGLWMEVYRNNSQNQDLYVLRKDADNANHQCYTDFTDIGRYICGYLESQGWEYVDEAV